MYKMETQDKTEELEKVKNMVEFEAYMKNKRYNGNGDRIDVIEMSKKVELVYERPDMMPIYKKYFDES
jgi:hypothetical protein